MSGTVTNTPGNLELMLILGLMLAVVWWMMVSRSLKGFVRAFFVWSLIMVGLETARTAIKLQASYPSDLLEENPLAWLVGAEVVLALAWLGVELRWRHRRSRRLLTRQAPLAAPGRPA